MIHPSAVTVAVSSAKGGAGKTTTALALAHTLQAAGKRTAVVDLDVSDPNLHLVAGVDGATPVEVTDDGVVLVVPVDAAGTAILSPLGFDRRANSSSLVTLAGYLDVDVVIFDLPPGIEAPHSELLGAGVRGWLIVAPPTAVGLAGHVDHVAQLGEVRRQALAEAERRRSDRRRKFVEPETTFASVETCGSHRGWLDGELVTIRRVDAVQADVAEQEFVGLSSDGVTHLGPVGPAPLDETDPTIWVTAEWVSTLA